MTEAFAADQLKQTLNRIERLEEEKTNLAQDIKEVYSEAKSNGLDPKIIKEIIRLRKKESHELKENAELLKLYSEAVGFDYQPFMF